MYRNSPANDDPDHGRERTTQLQIQEYFALNYPNGHPNDTNRHRRALTAELIAALKDLHAAVNTGRDAAFSRANVKARQLLEKIESWS